VYGILDRKALGWHDSEFVERSPVRKVYYCSWAALPYFNGSSARFAFMLYILLRGFVKTQTPTAVIGLLRPLIWQGTLITILPHNLKDIIDSPVPYVGEMNCYDLLFKRSNG